METADYSMTQMAFEKGRNSHIGDDTLFVEFSHEPIQDKKASEEKGRPIFKNVEFIKIMVPGRQDYVHRQARWDDIERFPKQYERFKQKETQKVDGTPLTAWPLLNKAQVEELKHFNIHTVEQLASVSDSAGQNFMGFNNLKQKAQLFLEAAEEGAPLSKLQSELEEKDNQIETMQKQIADLQAVVDELREDG